MIDTRSSAVACRCGAPTTRLDAGVCARCDLRNVAVVLTLACVLRPTHPREADILVRAVDGKADGLANERGHEQRRLSQAEARV